MQEKRKQCPIESKCVCDPLCSNQLDNQQFSLEVHSGKSSHLKWAFAWDFSDHLKGPNEWGLIEKKKREREKRSNCLWFEKLMG